MTDTTPFTAAAHTNDGKTHILLAATGSVATIKLPLIAESLSHHHHPNISIRIILTESASKFLNGTTPEQPSLASLLQLPSVDAIYRDSDEWSTPWTRGSQILHIELRKWAHLLLIAPLSANTLAKMTAGFADGLLLSVLRAWDTSGVVDGGLEGREVKRVFVAPAMNTAMWLHPVTERNMRVLREEWGVSEDGDGDGGGWITVLEPVEKGLACGDVGVGGMMDWREIVGVVEGYAGLKR